MSATRLSEGDIKGMFGRCQDSAREAGINVERWALKRGSSTYGRCWGIVSIDPATGGQRDLFVFGQTVRSAWDGLYAAAIAFEMVAYK